MTPRKQVLSAMAGERTDRVPFIIWDNKLPGDGVDEELLQLGACVIVKSAVYRSSTPGIKFETEETVGEDGILRKRTVYHTPAGDLSSVERYSSGSWWIEKKVFSSPDDYAALEALVRSRVHTPCYEEFIHDDGLFGEQGIARPTTIHSPMQEVMAQYMGVETFCIEWAENRERVLKLFDVVAEDRRRRIELAAASPAGYVVVEANIAVDVWGLERFERYSVPHIEEACEILHRERKWVGAHLDGDNRLIAPLVARTSLDLIESFTPPPDCDMSISEARVAWPEKTLMVNFPSSVHLAGAEKVHAVAAEIVREASPGDRFILGVLEDVPGRGKDTLVPLAQAVHDEGIGCSGWKL